MSEARKKASLTQQDLAKRLRRRQSFVAQGGERCIDVLELLTIAHAMKVLRTLYRRVI